MHFIVGGGDVDSNAIEFLITHHSNIMVSFYTMLITRRRVDFLI